MAPGYSSAGLLPGLLLVLVAVRLKPIAELLGPVVTDHHDESDPLFMGADGHSNNTRELRQLPEALLRFNLKLKDTVRSLSPVLRLSSFCLDSEYAGMPLKGPGPARCIRTLCKSKRASSCISKKLDAGEVPLSRRKRGTCTPLSSALWVLLHSRSSSKPL
jgi:hypothetical protein